MEGQRKSMDAEQTPVVDPEQAMAQMQGQMAQLVQQIQSHQQLLATLSPGDPNHTALQQQIELFVRNHDEVETQLHTISQAFGAGAVGTPMVGAVSSARGAELVTHEVITNAENTGGIPNIATFNMPERYIGATAIGSGSFGMVIQATDTVTNKVVAIKKIHGPWEMKVKAQRTYRELRMLAYLQESWPGAGAVVDDAAPMQHENIVAMLDCWMDPTDMYIAMEHGGSDLQTIMKTQKVSTEHVQFFGYQILRAFKFLHSAGIIHRDLKPGNIACNDQCDLKILDFGLARQSADATGMTGYVATRYYRAPEVILQPTNYGSPLDLWSFGCIMAELMLSLEWSQSHNFKMLDIGHPLGAPQPEPERPTVLTTEKEFPVRFDAEACPFRMQGKMTVWGNVGGQGVRELGVARMRSFEQDPQSGRLAITINTDVDRTLTDIMVMTAPVQNMFSGQDRVQQLEEIARVLGKPTEEYIVGLEQDVARKTHMCGIELGNPILPCQCGVAQREHWIRTLSDDHVRRPFNQLKRFECHEQDPELRKAYMLGIDLLEHILVYEPGGRYTAEQAIAHPFFEEYHDPDDEPVATHPFDNACEGWDLDAAQWKAKVAEEVARFNERR